MRHAHSVRRHRVAVAIGLMVLVAGGAFGCTRLPAPDAAPPPVAVTTSSAEPAPADRFRKGETSRDAEALVTQIVDRELADGDTRVLQLIEAADQHSIPPVAEGQPERAPTTIAGTEVLIGENGTLTEANWLDGGVRHVLLWDALPDQPVIRDADIRWIIERSLAGDW